MTNYIQIGRLVRVLRGPRKDKVAFVSAIIDANRILVENPADEKMWRHVQNLKNVEATKFSIKIGENASTKSIKEAMEKKDVITKYVKTGKAKKIASVQALANSTDFERYQLAAAKRSRAHHARKLFAAADEKTPVSWHAVLSKKLGKTHKKFADKKMAARHDRIKKYFAARKAAKKTAKK